MFASVAAVVKETGWGQFEFHFGLGHRRKKTCDKVVFKMRSCVCAVVVAALLLPALVVCRPLGQECEGKECDYFERHAEMMAQSGQEEREPQPDGYAESLYNRARSFEAELNKISGLVHTLGRSGRISSANSRSMQSMLRSIEHLYRNRIMATLDRFYPFIENRDTVEYRTAIQNANRWISELKTSYSRLMGMIENVARSAGLYGEVFPERVAYQNNLLTARRQSPRTQESTNQRYLDLMKRLQSYGRKRREIDLDDEMDFGEQQDNLAASVY